MYPGPGRPGFPGLRQSVRRPTEEEEGVSKEGGRERDNLGDGRWGGGYIEGLGGV